LNTLRLGDVVTLHYRLASAGQEIVNTFHDQPDTFTLGQNELDPRLETLILGLEPGQHQTFHLEAWQAFGQRDESLVQSLSRTEFPSDAALQAGHGVEFPLPNGEILVGTILQADAATVQVDFNHPLAGLPIEFEVELLTAERASSP
jgi:FKBP-type peptidyl-prolyl cis-trans isomerase SlpA